MMAGNEFKFKITMKRKKRCEISLPRLIKFVYLFTFRLSSWWCCNESLMIGLCGKYLRILKWGVKAQSTGLKEGINSVPKQCFR
jgi:hypothetical protein